MSDVLIPKRFAPVTLDAAISDQSMGFFVGGAGTVSACGVDGVFVTFTCTAGQYVAGRFTMIRTAGTSATGIVVAFSQ